MMSEHGIISKRSQDLVDHAFVFAKEAHYGQVRKYTNEPYINHPVAVARLCATVTDDIEIICAALLHDVMEDCGVTEQDLQNTGLGWGIAWTVQMVTDVSRSEDGNRAVRKAMDREHVAKGDAKGQTVKLADLLDNHSTIVQYDPQFAKVYMAEMAAMVPLLTKGHKALHSAAVTMLEEYYKTY